MDFYFFLVKFLVKFLDGWGVIAQENNRLDFRDEPRMDQFSPFLDPDNDRDSRII